MTDDSEPEPSTEPEPEPLPASPDPGLVTYEERDAGDYETA